MSYHLMLLLIVLDASQEHPPAATSPVQATSAEVRARDSSTDPTQPSPALRAFMTAPANPSRNVQSSERVPGFVRRGYIETSDRPAEAILEVEEFGFLTVRQGCTATVSSKSGEMLTVRVLRLAPEETEIELPGTRKSIVVR